MNNTKPTFCINTLLGASLYKDVFWLGAEIREDTLTGKAQGNLLHCNFKNMDLMLGDGRKMCYRPGVIDTVISGKYTTLVLPIFLCIHHFYLVLRLAMGNSRELVLSD